MASDWCCPDILYAGRLAMVEASFTRVILHFDIDTYWIYTANYFREIIYHVYKSVLYIIARFFRFTYDTMKA